MHVVRTLLSSGEIAQARKLLEAVPDVAVEESQQLAWAALWIEVDPDRALGLADLILTSNKACAAAYRIKATAFRRRGDTSAAQKLESVAEVITEALPIEDQSANQAVEIPPLTVPSDGLVDDLSDEDFFEIEESLARMTPQPRLPTFQDVAGMEAVKERIRLSIIIPLQRPELAAKYGKRPGGGVLLYGPPGCGKTLFALAAAGESGATFCSLEITQVLSKWFGESEKQIHSFFETARSQTPAIVFLDEIDALAGKRSESAPMMSSLVNVLLTEIDSSTSRNDSLLIIGATNMPWRIDSAFRRPGRFDRVVFVPPPDLPARIELLRSHFSDLPIETLDLRKLAMLMERFSGADIRLLVEQVAEEAMFRELKSGAPGSISQRAILALAKKMKPSTREWLDQAANYASFANAAGLYDDLADYLKQQWH